MATTKADQPGTTLDVGSAAFQEAVAAAVRAQMVSHPPATVAVQSPAIIPVSSIDTTRPGLDDLTVRFRRFCTFQNAGYQKGQEAGFPRKAAEALHAGGAASIVHDPRRQSGQAR